MEATLTHCPLPRLTVAIGVTGHRKLPPGSEAGLRQRVADVLGSIVGEVEKLARSCRQEPLHGLYSDEAPRFVLLSALAAGADCLVAEEALRLGFELHVPLPMAEEEYARDFEDEASLARFRALLHSEPRPRVLEICAANPERGHAYADAARAMLNHSDIVLALWDGIGTDFVAGTAATLDMAATMHIPALHLHPDAAQPIRLLNDGFCSAEWEKGLNAHLRSILLPQAQQGSGGDLDFARICSAQQAIRMPLMPNLEKWVAHLFGVIPQRGQQAKEAVAAPRETSPWQPCFQWFDHLSNAYSVRYRSCLVLRFAAPVAAIFFLVLALNGPSWWGKLDTATAWGIDLLVATFFVLQIVLLFSTIVLEGLDRRVLWHKKFFSYRVMSELFRQTKQLWPVGYCNVRNKARTYSGNTQRWTTWYYRAMARHEGMPDARVDEGYLSTWMEKLNRDFVLDQIAYHSNRQKREGLLSNRLFRMGMLLFILSIIVSALRGCLSSAGWPSNDLCLTIAGAAAVIIPSLAVFCTGFCGYAGYPKNQQVSKEEVNCLNSISRDIHLSLGRPAGTAPDDIPYELPGELHYGHALRIAGRVHDCCNEELMDWEELISAKGI